MSDRSRRHDLWLIVLAIIFYKTSSSAISEGPRDALCPSKRCQLPHSFIGKIKSKRLV